MILSTAAAPPVTPASREIGVDMLWAITAPFDGLRSQGTTSLADFLGPFVRSGLPAYRQRLEDIFDAADRLGPEYAATVTAGRQAVDGYLTFIEGCSRDTRVRPAGVIMGEIQEQLNVGARGLIDFASTLARPPQ